MKIVTGANPPLDELVHYGVKGMHWGIRNDREGGLRTQASPPHIEPGFHTNTKNAAVEVSGLISERYGYNIRNVKVLGPENPEYPGALAYVENNKRKGSSEGTIYVQSQDLTNAMKTTEKIGWLAPGTGNVKALLTHESAHSIFHSNQTVSIGVLGGQKIAGGNIKARDKALKAAAKAAKIDGRSIWEISGYAQTAGVREELEGELFSQYHWATNPPRFVKVWGQTLHQELGVDPTPFKEVK